MKILLDEMMPEELGAFLFGHEVFHVTNLGWRQVSNGKLLNLAEADGFEVFVTKDTNLAYQQTLLTGK